MAFATGIVTMIGWLRPASAGLPGWQETLGFLGFPVARYIDVNDSEDVLRAIQMTDGDLPLDIILHTSGGLVPAALRIA